MFYLICCDSLQWSLLLSYLTTGQPLSIWEKKKGDEGLVLSLLILYKSISLCYIFPCNVPDSFNTTRHMQQTSKHFVWSRTIWSASWVSTHRLVCCTVSSHMIPKCAQFLAIANMRHTSWPCINCTDTTKQVKHARLQVNHIDLSITLSQPKVHSSSHFGFKNR